jgi:hypothetical protein
VAALVLVAAGGLPGGCSWPYKMTELGGRVAPDTLSLADHCAEIMQKAMPFADIAMGDRTSTSPDLRTIVATVTGTRSDLPKGGSADGNLAVECTFVDNVLTGFRWTKGGPPPSPH